MYLLSLHYAIAIYILWYFMGIGLSISLQKKFPHIHHFPFIFSPVLGAALIIIVTENLSYFGIGCKVSSWACLALSIAIFIYVILFKNYKLTFSLSKHKAVIFLLATTFTLVIFHNILFLGAGDFVYPHSVDNFYHVSNASYAADLTTYQENQNAFINGYHNAINVYKYYGTRMGLEFLLAFNSTLLFSDPFYVFHGTAFAIYFIIFLIAMTIPISMGSTAPITTIIKGILLSTAACYTSVFLGGYYPNSAGLLFAIPMIYLVCNFHHQFNYVILFASSSLFTLIVSCYPEYLPLISYIIVSYIIIIFFKLSLYKQCYFKNIIFILTTVVIAVAIDLPAYGRLFKVFYNRLGILSGSISHGGDVVIGKNVFADLATLLTGWNLTNPILIYSLLFVFILLLYINAKFAASDHDYHYGILMLVSVICFTFLSMQYFRYIGYSYGIKKTLLLSCPFIFMFFPISLNFSHKFNLFFQFINIVLAVILIINNGFFIRRQNQKIFNTTTINDIALSGDIGGLSEVLEGNATTPKRTIGACIPFDIPAMWASYWLSREKINIEHLVMPRYFKLWGVHSADNLREYNIVPRYGCDIINHCTSGSVVWGNENYKLIKSAPFLVTLGNGWSWLHLERKDTPYRWTENEFSIIVASTVHDKIQLKFDCLVPIRGTLTATFCGKKIYEKSFANESKESISISDFNLTPGVHEIAFSYKSLSGSKNGRPKYRSGICVQTVNYFGRTKRCDFSEALPPNSLRVMPIQSKKINDIVINYNQLAEKCYFDDSILVKNGSSYVTLADGWYKTEILDTNDVVRWMKPKGNLIVEAFQDVDLVFEISILYGVKGKLNLFIGEQFVEQKDLDGTNQKIVFNPIPFKEGRHKISFIIHDKGVMPYVTDNRSLSILVTEIAVSEILP